MANYGPISSKMPSGSRPYLRRGAGYLNYSHNLRGTVTEVQVSFALRIPHNGEITSSRNYTGIKFYLYRKDYPSTASFPSNWTAHGGFYYGTTNLTESDIPNENILAQNLNFSYGPTDRIQGNCSTTFELTNFGKDLSNWSGEVVLACTNSGTETNGRNEILQWGDGGTCSYSLTYLEQSVIPTSSLAPITLGTTSTINFISYSSSYTHEITWKLGSKSKTISVSAGKTSESYSIPTSWRDQFSTTESAKEGNVSIKTKDSNGNQIGIINSYEVIYKIDNYDLSSSIKLTCSKVTPSSSDRFSNDKFSDYLVKNYHKVRLAVTASADYNNTIKKYTLTYGSNGTVTGTGAGTLADVYIYNGTSGSYSITDSRDKTRTINFNKLTGISQTLMTYTPCSYSSIEFYRATANGTKDELGGSCVKVIINDFKLSTTNPSISGGLHTSIKIQVGKGSQTITPTASGKIDTTITNAELSTDKEYQLTITFSDISGLSTPFTGKILSSNYLLHFRKGQASVGIGQAARDISSGSYSDYSEGLLSINYQIELARGLSSQRCFTSPIRTVDGGTGCSDLDVFVDKIASSILAKAYPIGSLYFTTNATNPKNILGFGTWTAWGQGKVPIGVNSSNSNFNSPEKTGGQEQITLTEEQMPKHKHYPLKKSESTGTRSENGTDFDENATDNSEAWSFQVATHINGSTERVKKGSSSNQYIIANSTMENLWTDVSTGYAGESKSFSIMQPYITCYMWKRTA